MNSLQVNQNMEWLRYGAGKITQLDKTGYNKRKSNTQLYCYCDSHEFDLSKALS